MAELVLIDESLKSSNKSVLIIFAIIALILIIVLYLNYRKK